jgi:hypothetical protein
LAAGHSVERPGFWLHTGGTSILIGQEEQGKGIGEASDRVYGDIDDLEEVRGWPIRSTHREVDGIILDANNQPGLYTAIVAPPTIYGKR